MPGPRTVEQLMAIIDAVPTAVIMVDAQGKVELVNAQAERLFGYIAAELEGRYIDMLVPGRAREGHPALRASFTRAPKARPMGAGRELYGLRKDGTEFPVEIGLTPVTTDQGHFVVSAIVDISERKRLEARFRATVESAPSAMLMVDQGGSIVLVNAEAERLFGYGREELLGRKVELLIPQRLRSSHPVLRTDYFSVPKARRMGAGRELYGLRKDGSEFPIEIGLNPVKTEDGTFVICAIVDISERKRLADATLQRANEALERSNIELQRFAYVASHDLQTPMRSIASFVDLFQSTYGNSLDPQGKDWLRRVSEAVKTLQTLVRDLLDYSRIDSQARPFENVPLREVFDQCVVLLQETISEAAAEVTCGELPEVMGDRSQLVQLLLNLIGNALKYRADRPPRVRVSAQQGPTEWTIAVRDNGIGIAPQHQAKIFDIFQRLHSQREYPGTGIGLAVCRRVVLRHGGRIWVESEPGQESTFYFTLPREGNAV